MGLFPKQAAEYVAQAGIPTGPLSKIYVVDPVNGSASNTGLSFKSPLLGLEAAFALATANQNDTIILVGGATGIALADTITWNKSYTHLIGLSADLPGVGQRCRVTCSTSPDETQVMTVSGNGCIFRNIQFYNGTDANADSGAVSVTGNRNEFTNCFFAGMAHATPGARAGSYSLTVSGQENLFRDCAIGLDTIVRAAANAELVLASGATRNVFRHCRFLSYSETAGKFLVSVADGVDRWNEFEDCVFQNFSVNWATTLTDAFNVTAAATHQIVLRGLNQLVGVTGWANTVTHLYSAAQQSNAGFGVQVNPTA